MIDRFFTHVLVSFRQAEFLASYATQVHSGRAAVPSKRVRDASESAHPWSIGLSRLISSVREPAIASFRQAGFDSPRSVHETVKKTQNTVVASMITNEQSSSRAMAHRSSDRATVPSKRVRDASESAHPWPIALPRLISSVREPAASSLRHGLLTHKYKQPT